MKEIRIHARAGQGAITTASIRICLFSKACTLMPSQFWAARMGAPMNAFCVLILSGSLKKPDYEPNYLLIVDHTIMRGFNCFSV